MFETSFSPVTPESAETLLSAYPAFGSGDCNLTAVSLISRAAARKASFAVIEGIPVVRWHPTGEEAAYAVPACAEKMKPVLEHLSEEAPEQMMALAGYHDIDTKLDTQQIWRAVEGRFD